MNGDHLTYEELMQHITRRTLSLKATPESENTRAAHLDMCQKCKEDLQQLKWIDDADPANRMLRAIMA